MNSSTALPTIPERAEDQNCRIYTAIGDVVKSRMAFSASSSVDRPPGQSIWVVGNIESTLLPVWNYARGSSAHTRPSRADHMVAPLNGALSSSTLDEIECELLLESQLIGIIMPLVYQAESETFEDGMHSKFAEHVDYFIRCYGPAAVCAWERVLLRVDNLYETGEEFLRQIGLLEHTPSYATRLRVLKDSLKSPDPRIRDAAGLGLSFLDDPAALPALQTAHGTETEDWLKDNLGLVIDQLMDSAYATVHQSSTPSPLV